MWTDGVIDFFPLRSAPESSADSIVERVDQGAPSHRRISELVDSVQLTRISALTGFRPVPRVRIQTSPPRSLSCRETRLHSPENRWKPQFRNSSPQTGPENSVP